MSKYYTVKTYDANGKEIWLHNMSFFDGDAMWTHEAPATTNSLFRAKKEITQLLNNPGFIELISAGPPANTAPVEWYEVQVKVEYTPI